MSDEPPKLHIISPGGNPDIDMPSLRMCAVETAAMITPSGPTWRKRVIECSERLVRYVLYGDRDDA